MKDFVPMKISLKLRGEDGSIWNYQPPCKSDGKEIIPLLPHLADMSTYMFKGVINFAKVISYFRYILRAGPMGIICSKAP